MIIDLLGCERSGAIHPAGHRRSERRTCDLAATVVSPRGEWRARIINISAGGLGFTIDPLFALKPGQRILVREPVLGEVWCTVQWTLHPRYGAVFTPPGRTPHGAATLYDSLGAGATG